MDYNTRINRQKKEEWDELHNFERQGFTNNQMRVLNKDPSIYEKNLPSVIQKFGGDKYKTSSFDNLTPKLQNLRLEEESKKAQDKIRQKNIERAMRELEGSKKSNVVSENEADFRQRKSAKGNDINFNSADLYKVNQPNLYDNIDSAKNSRSNLNRMNYFINNNKDARDKNILPDPDDIDDLDEGSRDNVTNQIRNQINVSNLSQKEHVTDDIENAYDKMQKFDKMHQFK